MERLSWADSKGKAENRAWRVLTLLTGYTETCGCLAEYNQTDQQKAVGPDLRGSLLNNGNSHRKVRNSVRVGPPPLTVDTTIFEMWLGRLSTHQGLSIPVV